MQKAIIIQSFQRDQSISLSSKELNDYLYEGWRVVSATPFGVSVSSGGQGNFQPFGAAILVIIEQDKEA